MTDSFQTALDQHEIPDFFKGSGRYFARGCDWGDHLHIGNWQGLCAALKTQDTPQNTLTRLFETYVVTLKENYVDAQGLLCNITAYYVLKSKITFLSAQGYDLIEALGETSTTTVGVLFRLLRQVYDKENQDLPKYSFAEELQRLKDRGCTVDLEKL